MYNIAIIMILTLILLVMCFIAICNYRYYIYQSNTDKYENNEQFYPNLRVTPPANYYPNVSDPLKIYDYRVMNDPLKEPTRRPPRDIIGPAVASPWFNYPTRGWPDNYTLQGYLVDNNGSNNDPNKILSLYGRQKYPGSNEYEYYVSFISDDDRIKYKLDKYRRELYDDDEVVIDILQYRKYRVKLFKEEGIIYNPFMF